MAHYLPVLLASVSTNAIPDDSSLVTLPRGQVDYLSHEWAEEDVWRSWRNMTRQKNEIANGMRLENASWRTWWKQRNKLKTVTPETLNWLKDSDVTWLYGPLHTAVEWSPPPKPKPDPTEVGKLSSAEDRLDLAAKHKPILKYRSVAELLQSDLPLSPAFSPAESDDDEKIASALINVVTRPPFLHTKSAPHIPPLPHTALRRPSPPRTVPPSMAAPNPARRHITFNTFVEQCIAVDSPRRTPLSHNSSSDSSSGSNLSGDAEHPNITDAARAAWDGRTRGMRWEGNDSDGEDDDDDDDGGGGGWGGESALSSDSDDDVLEVCLPRSRSNSSHSNGSGSRDKQFFGFSTNPNRSNSHSSGNGNGNGNKTIAPIAPARLKTTGVGNGWGAGEWVGTREEGVGLPVYGNGRDPDQVYLPRSNAAVDLAAQNQLSSAFDDTDDSFEEEDVDADALDDEDPTFTIPSSNVNSNSNGNSSNAVFTHRSAYFSADADGAYDYFAGPDLGVGFATPPRDAPRGRRGSSGAGAGSAPGVEILQIERPRDRDRERNARSTSRSKSRSRSRTPSPAVLPGLSTSPTKNSNSNNYSNNSTSLTHAYNAGTGVSPAMASASPRAGGLLSPPPRGRDSSLSSSSTNSTSASQGRGRSATRTSSSSSLSDRERSRSSHTSPLGSLSPEYSGVRSSAGSEGGFVYGGGIAGGMGKSLRRTKSSSLSPDVSPVGSGASASPEKASVSVASTTSTENNSLNSNSNSNSSSSNSSGATATRPRVEVNGVGGAGMGATTGEIDDWDGRGRNSSPRTPANSPVVRVRAPIYISPAVSPQNHSARSSESGSGRGTPTGGGVSAGSSSSGAYAAKKPTSPTSKSIPISPPRPGQGQRARLSLDVGSGAEEGGAGEDRGEEEDDDDNGTRRANPTPANSPVVRVRVPPRIPNANVNSGAGTGAKGQSTAKSIPMPKPPPSPPKHTRQSSSSTSQVAPVSPARATFQTAGAGANTGGGGGAADSASASALQRTLNPEAGAAEAGIVGKAVGMVSTAGAYLGLWSGA